MDQQNKSMPLIVDLDGTLSKTDTLVESFLLLMKHQFFRLFLLPFALLQGKAAFKKAIAQPIQFDASGLLYDEAVKSYIKQARLDGREVYLATGADEKIAQSVADYLGLFDGVFASSGGKNMTGSAKAELLIERFGDQQFEYMGNAAVDLKVWKHAAKAVVVSPKPETLSQKAKGVCQNLEIIEQESASLKTYLKAVRLHQWVKNALLFVPLLTAHLWQDPSAWLTVLVGFFSFSFAASSVYVLNDLLDLAADRQHPTKSKRPFAAGLIPLEKAAFLFPLFFITAFGLCVFLPLGYLAALSVYYTLTVAYSFYLKRVVMLDTVTLAALYTMRIIAGTFLIDVSFSFWLLSFSMFIFLSLALLKRYTELVQMQAEGKTKTLGRGYQANDASMVASLGAASGYLSVLVMALYVHSPEVQLLYSSQSFLWFVCPILLFWISRAWMIAHRGEMNDDPIVFAVKDKQSLITGALIGFIFLLASRNVSLPF